MELYLPFFPILRIVASEARPDKIANSDIQSELIRRDKRCPPLFTLLVKLNSSKNSTPFEVHYNYEKRSVVSRTWHVNVITYIKYEKKKKKNLAFASTKFLFITNRIKWNIQ